MSTWYVNPTNPFRVLKDNVPVALCERTDDARLIAAAPEMLEALNNICLPRETQSNDTVMVPLIDIERAHDAIAKARGEGK